MLSGGSGSIMNICTRVVLGLHCNECYECVDLVVVVDAAAVVVAQGLIKGE